MVLRLTAFRNRTLKRKEGNYVCPALRRTPSIAHAKGAESPPKDVEGTSQVQQFERAPVQLEVESSPREEALEVAGREIDEAMEDELETPVMRHSPSVVVEPSSADILDFPAREPVAVIAAEAVERPESPRE